MLFVNRPVPEGNTSKGDARLLGSAGSLEMDGSTIYVDKALITSQSTPRRINSDVFVSKVLAHEAGHKLSLEHPFRDGCCSVNSAITSASQLDSLNEKQYAMFDIESDEIYVRLRSYRDPEDMNREYTNEMPVIRYNNRFVKIIKREKVVDSATLAPVYKVKLASTIRSTQANANQTNTPTLFMILEIQQKLMDWTAVRILRTAESWKFNESAPPTTTNRSYIEQIRVRRMPRDINSCQKPLY